MLDFLRKEQVLGIEISPVAVRMVAFKTGANSQIHTAKADLCAGAVCETYSSENIQDREKLIEALRACLSGMPEAQSRRAGICLADGIFRVHTQEFDELPGKAADRERLIRWRLEKTAPFDLSDTVLRYRVLQRQNAGFTVLACIARKPLIAQYEAALLELGIEPWFVGLASFSTLNFYASYLTNKPTACVFLYATQDSFATIVLEKGGVRFYRFKDIKRGSADEIRSRLVREIEDSIHFYMHMDRSQPTEVKQLYLSGEPAILDMLAAELSSGTSFEVDVLSPGVVLPSAAGAGTEMTAALGAGKSA